MDASEQFNVVNAWHEGMPVYWHEKRSTDEYHWEQVDNSHVFDFSGNVYNIGQPLSFEDALAQNDSVSALHLAVDYLEKKEPGFILGATTTDPKTGQTTAEFKIVRLNDLYKLWNIAVNYGRTRGSDIEPVTKETGEFTGYLGG